MTKTEMMRAMKGLACLAAAIALPACAKAQEIAAGKAAFDADCSLCHDASPARATFQGPPLFGVVGRKTGAVSGFAYSAALKSAGAKGQVWTAAALDRFLTDPQKAMPGTAMPVSVADAKTRKAIIAYLSSLNGGKAKAAPKPVIKPVMKPAASASAAQDWRADAPGVAHTVTAADLPAPYATQSAGNSAHYAAPDAGKLPVVPAGFAVSVFADGLDGPRLLRAAPNGDLYAVASETGKVLVWRNAGGRLAAQPETFATGLRQPFGVAFYPLDKPRFVYIANVDSIVRVPIGGGAAQTVVAHLSTAGGHHTRDIAFSPDGRYMYVSVGSGSNVAENMGAMPAGWIASHAPGEPWGSEAGRAMVLRFTPDGQDRHVVATGIRNCVSLAVRPGSDALYCVTNERDALGDNLVPDYFTQVKDGQFFGWPWWYLGDHQDPRHKGERGDLKGHVSLPDTLFASHSAPLGLVFYRPAPGGAANFPADYTGDAFITLHGSWNRAQRTGSKLVRVRFDHGRPSASYEDFMTGLIVDDHTVNGRPVGVTVGPDGALYVSDDAGGRIWRIAPVGK
ncbi:MAG TPA: PQQ-dependent sugar dehydrogenase [Asticcacaulis sp.]